MLVLCLLGARGAFLPVFDPVELGRRAVLERAFEAIEDALEPVEPPLDALPARRDQVDEDGEVLDARAPLRVEVELEALEAPGGLVREAAQLGDVAADRQDLAPHALPDRGAEAHGDGGLELGGPLGERLERLAGATDRRVERGRVRALPLRLGEAAPGPLERLAFHGADASVGAGRC